MAQKRVVSIRLAEEQVEYLERTARRMGRTTSQTAAMLIDEGMRRERHPQIELRETAAGRIAYIKGTRLPVWMMAERVWDGETPEEIAEGLEVPVSQIQAAVAYAEAFRKEIEDVLEDVATFDADPGKFLPGYTSYRVNAPSP